MEVIVTLRVGQTHAYTHTHSYVYTRAHKLVYTYTHTHTIELKKSLGKRNRGRGIPQFGLGAMLQEVLCETCNDGVGIWAPVSGGGWREEGGVTDVKSLRSVRDVLWRCIKGPATERLMKGSREQVMSTTAEGRTMEYLKKKSLKFL